MNGLRWRPISAVALALALGLACGGDGDDGGPTNGGGPDTLVLSLITPNNDDGAILFTISGGDIDSPTAASAADVLFFRSTGATSISAVIVGDISAGALVEFEVPAGTSASSYTTTITEVADRSNALRGSVAGYSLSVGS